MAIEFRAHSGKIQYDQMRLDCRSVRAALHKNAILADEIGRKAYPHRMQPAQLQPPDGVIVQSRFVLTAFGVHGIGTLVRQEL